MEAEHENTCHKEVVENTPSLFQNGGMVFQVYHVGWIICGFFTLIAMGVSFWLINKHLQWYTNKREQRYIVRILFMVPIYAIISFASYLFWNNAVVLVLIRDAYEAIVLTAFFYLLLMYLSPDPEVQKAIFVKSGLSKAADRQAELKGEEVKKWLFPLGWVKAKPADGLYFLQLMKWAVLQYCVVRPVSTLAAVVLEYMGLYCEESWSPGWGHVYIIVIISLSVSVAMYCLIQLYVAVATELAPHRPLLKFFAVKAVVFLTFWQATALSGLSMLGVIKDSDHMTAADINVGILALLETVEMTIFAFLHIKAFTYKPYRAAPSPDSDTPPQRTPRLRSLGHAFDFRDTFREIWAGCVYMYDKIRGRPPMEDYGARRQVMYEEAFGRPRPSQLPVMATNEPKSTDSKRNGPTLPDVEVEVKRGMTIDVEGERQWLGTGDDYGYGLGFLRKERSDSLGAQIDRELEKRGYNSLLRADQQAALQEPTHPRQQSWWQRLYKRVSHASVTSEQQRTFTPSSQLNGRRDSRHHRVARDREMNGRLLQDHDIDLDEPPPPSVIRGQRNRIQSWARNVSEQTSIDRSLDVVAPRSILLDHRHQRKAQQTPHSGESRPGAPPMPQAYHRTSQNVNFPVPPPRPRNTPIARKDSLLARVFPYDDNESSVAHGYVSDSGVSHPSAAPRAPATPLARVVMRDAHNIMVERQPGLSLDVRVTELRYGPPVQSPPSPSPHVATILENMPVTQSPPPMNRPIDAPPPPATQSHRRESAFHAPDEASPEGRSRPTIPPAVVADREIPRSPPPVSMSLPNPPGIVSPRYHPPQFPPRYAWDGGQSIHPPNVAYHRSPSPPLHTSPLLQAPPTRQSFNMPPPGPPHPKPYHPQRLTVPAPLAPPSSFPLQQPQQMYRGPGGQQQHRQHSSPPQSAPQARYSPVHPSWVQAPLPRAKRNLPSPTPTYHTAQTHLTSTHPGQARLGPPTRTHMPQEQMHPAEPQYPLSPALVPQRLPTNLKELPPTPRRSNFISAPTSNDQPNPSSPRASRPHSPPFPMPHFYDNMIPPKEPWA